MVIILVATALFQSFLYSSFLPLVQQVPFCAAQTSFLAQPHATTLDKSHARSKPEWVDDFTNDLLKMRRTVIWIPNDTIGLSAERLHKIRTELHRVLATNEKALITLDGKVQISGIPSCINHQLSHS